MSTSGSGTGTPITPGAPAAGSAVTPLPYTHLSLARYAKIMGLNPAHFWRATAPNAGVGIFPIVTCSNTWPRHSWQNHDMVSHEELTYAIQQAEDELEGLVGYHLAPEWSEQELVPYPREFYREADSDGYDVRLRAKTVTPLFSKVIAPGRRAVTLVGTASTAGGSLSFLDLDGDGLAETARVVLATTLTNASEIKLYFSGNNALREWEIRPVRSRVISGGTLTILLDSWLLIDPEELAAYPDTGGFRAIDISTTAHYVTSVEAWREYNDPSQVSVQFYWQSDDNGMTQDGTLLTTEPILGGMTAMAAHYDVATATWVGDIWASTDEIAPDWAKLWYYSGDRDGRFGAGYSTEPLSDFWAQTITWLASARLTRPLCGCGSAADLAEHLAEDLSLSESGRAHFMMPQLLSNPLGSRRGEVMAWRRVSKIIRDRRVHFALV